ncbi:uncharacterized protein LOC115632808 [Scaptodrosophila lebanonensis]|uniref:Uncharacterized protein LOC115632808 n=1 Tax=Drosophila lebanonensis TaxID=7225 RepID=A0A6J2UCU4_DROLE|nr:uncharacterized protein LOC115632808 [Scaptodrosophila lebanonensis]
MSTDSIIFMNFSMRCFKFIFIYFITIYVLESLIERTD